MTIAIIGAGMAGLSAAGALLERGEAVILFDKGRGPGGRMSTRRTMLGDRQFFFDHGASAFTAAGPQFRKQVELWERSGLVQPWQRRRVRFTADGRMTDILDEADVRVGVPRMSALVKALAADFEVRWGVRICDILETSDGFRLSLDTGAEEGLFSRVIVAVPAEQSSPLLERVAPGLSQSAGAVISDPCWSVMCVFPATARTGWDAAEFENHPIDIASNDSSKPQRSGWSSWVLQARTDWSRDHLEDDAEQVSEALVAEFQARTGLPDPVFHAAHRWRFSRPRVAEPVETLWRADDRVGICGDWCVDGSVEGAWLSGQNLVSGLEQYAG